MKGFRGSIVTSVLVVALAVLIFPPLAAGPIAAAPLQLPAVTSGLTLQLNAAYGGSVGQGMPYQFWAQATNSGSTSQPIDVLFYLQDSGGATSVAFREWRGTVPAGGTVSFPSGGVNAPLNVTTSQWFADIGPNFVISATNHGTPVGNTLTFTVTAPAVVVPTFQNVNQTAFGSALATLTNLDASQQAGAAWGDINNDGYPDLYLPVSNGPAQLWVYVPSLGTFQEEAAQWGVQNLNNSSCPGTYANGVNAAFVDYDNDGYEDLYAVNNALDSSSQPTCQGSLLYRNNLGSGSSTFSEVTVGVESKSNGAWAAWGDYDRDGLLDLYLVTINTTGVSPMTYAQSDHLFHQLPNHTFEDVTSLLPAPSGWTPPAGWAGGSPGSGFQAMWIDYDNDGWPDLYLAQDDLTTLADPDMNRLYHNNAGQGFTDVCATDSSACLAIHSMGIGIGDFNRDGQLDLAISNVGGPSGGNQLLQRNASSASPIFLNRSAVDLVNRPWDDVTTESVTWGMGFYDLNLDGLEDLLVVAGELPVRDAIPLEPNQSNELFVNGGPPFYRFRDLSAPSGIIDPNLSDAGRGAAFADFGTRDGLEDVFVVNLDGQPILYKNTTPKGNRHWLEVRLQGNATTDSRDACGAKVTAMVGSTTELRQESCDADDKVLLFGLNTSTSANLTVQWLSGATTNVGPVAADQIITVTE